MTRAELVDKLAANAIDGMDMDAIIEYATEKLEEWYDKQTNKTLEGLAKSELLETVKITK